MSFWAGMAVGIVIGATAGWTGIAVATGLARKGVDEIRQLCLDLVEEIKEPTPQVQRKKTLS